MPKIPTYRLHKATQQAVVTIAKHDYYLGKYGTKESHDQYNALVNKWQTVKGELTATALRKALRGRSSRATAKKDAISLLDAAKSYRDWSKKRYSTAEHANIEGMLKVVLSLYLHEKAENIGPAELRKIRSQMLAKDWSRKYVNSQIGRIKRWYKWLAAQPYIQSAVYNDLKMVEGLRRGEDGAGNGSDSAGRR
jgi:hypothetical protein